jgi:hypothetical protein
MFILALVLLRGVPGATFLLAALLLVAATALAWYVTRPGMLPAPFPVTEPSRPIERLPADDLPLPL